MTITTADYDTIVVGGGPSGATAAHDLARQGHNVLLLERGFRIKPCGGAIPPCLLEEFDIPEHLLKARIRSARMVSQRGESVDMPIDGTFVGMVDREEFDEWLRERAALLQATGLIRALHLLQGHHLQILPLQILSGEMRHLRVHE